MATNLSLSFSVLWLALRLAHRNLLETRRWKIVRSDSIDRLLFHYFSVWFPFIDFWRQLYLEMFSAGCGGGGGGGEGFAPLLLTCVRSNSILWWMTKRHSKHTLSIQDGLANKKGKRDQRENIYIRNTENKCTTIALGRRFDWQPWIGNVFLFFLSSSPEWQTGSWLSFTPCFRASSPASKFLSSEMMNRIKFHYFGLFLVMARGENKRIYITFWAKDNK